MQRFEAAIFDMDGLLLDSERPIRDAWLTVSAECGVPLDEASYLGAIGRNAADSRAHLMSVCGEGFDFDAALARVALLLEQRHCVGGYALKAGARELLEWLALRHIPCAVASSSSHEEIERRLTKAGIRDFFVGIVGGDQVRRGKPAPDLYLAACELVGGLAPSRCLAFEDSEPGAAAALAAGMAVVIVPDLRPPSADVAAQAFATLASLHEALAHCGSWFEGSR